MVFSGVAGYVVAWAAVMVGAEQLRQGRGRWVVAVSLLMGLGAATSAPSRGLRRIALESKTMKSGVGVHRGLGPDIVVTGDDRLGASTDPVRAFPKPVVSVDNLPCHSPPPRFTPHAPA